MTAPRAVVRGPDRVWFVRHGETEGQSSIRFHGRNDVPLSQLGREQIAALAPLLAGIAPALIVHSPLQRAVASAQLLAERLGWPRSSLRSDERLQEISFGACEGMTEGEIAAAFPGFWAARQQGEVEAFPDGERRSDFTARVAAGIAAALDACAGGDLVVVAHRGTVRQGLRHVLAVPAAAPDPLPQFRVRLGSLSVVACSPGPQVELLDFVP